jgi:hypothetical protein
MITIKIYNRSDIFVTMYDTCAVPNVGENICVWLGGCCARYCEGKVTERLFGKDCVAITIDSDCKPLSDFERNHFDFDDDDDY